MHCNQTVVWFSLTAVQLRAEQWSLMGLDHFARRHQLILDTLHNCIQISKWYDASNFFEKTSEETEKTNFSQCQEAQINFGSEQRMTRQCIVTSSTSLSYRWCHFGCPKELHWDWGIFYYTWLQCNPSCFTHYHRQQHLQPQTLAHCCTKP